MHLDKWSWLVMSLISSHGSCPFDVIWTFGWCAFGHFDKNEKSRHHSISIVKVKVLVNFICRMLVLLLLIYKFWSVSSDWFSRWGICGCPEVDYDQREVSDGEEGATSKK